MIAWFCSVNLKGIDGLLSGVSRCCCVVSVCKRVNPSEYWYIQLKVTRFEMELSWKNVGLETVDAEQSDTQCARPA